MDKELIEKCRLEDWQISQAIQQGDFKWCPQDGASILEFAHNCAETTLIPQLAKAIPIIQKAERERVIAVINSHNSIEYPYGGDFKSVILQALKGETNE